MGFFTKDKPIDCYKQVNKIIKSMYSLKKTLILKADSMTGNDMSRVMCDLNDVICSYNTIVRMEYKHLMTQQNIYYGTKVVDYEGESVNIREFIDKVKREIDIVKRITQGAPVIMSEVNPNSIPNDFFYDEHKVGVHMSVYYETPPMFYI